MTSPSSAAKTQALAGSPAESLMIDFTMQGTPQRTVSMLAPATLAEAREAIARRLGMEKTDLGVVRLGAYAITSEEDWTEAITSFWQKAMKQQLIQQEQTLRSLLRTIETAVTAATTTGTTEVDAHVYPAVEELWGLADIATLTASFLRAGAVTALTALLAIPAYHASHAQVIAILAHLAHVHVAVTQMSTCRTLLRIWDRVSEVLPPTAPCSRIDKPLPIASGGLLVDAVTELLASLASTKHGLEHLEATTCAAGTMDLLLRHSSHASTSKLVAVLCRVSSAKREWYPTALLPLMRKPAPINRKSSRAEMPADMVPPDTTSANMSSTSRTAVTSARSRKDPSSSRAASSAGRARSSSVVGVVQADIVEHLVCGIQRALELSAHVDDVNLFMAVGAAMCSIWLAQAGEKVLQSMHLRDSMIRVWLMQNEKCELQDSGEYAQLHRHLDLTIAAHLLLRIRAWSKLSSHVHKAPTNAPLERLQFDNRVSGCVYIACTLWASMASLMHETPSHIAESVTVSHLLAVLDAATHMLDAQLAYTVRSGMGLIATTAVVARMAAMITPDMQSFLAVHTIRSMLHRIRELENVVSHDSTDHCAMHAILQLAATGSNAVLAELWREGAFSCIVHMLELGWTASGGVHQLRSIAAALMLLSSQCNDAMDARSLQAVARLVQHPDVDVVRFSSLAVWSLGRVSRNREEMRSSRAPSTVVAWLAAAAAAAASGNQLIRSQALQGLPDSVASVMHTEHNAHQVLLCALAATWALSCDSVTLRTMVAEGALQILTDIVESKSRKLAVAHALAIGILWTAASHSEMRSSVLATDYHVPESVLDLILWRKADKLVMMRGGAFLLDTLRDQQVKDRLVFKHGDDTALVDMWIKLLEERDDVCNKYVAQHVAQSANTTSMKSKLLKSGCVDAICGFCSSSDDELLLRSLHAVLNLTTEPDIQVRVGRQIGAQLSSLANGDRGEEAALLAGRALLNLRQHPSNATVVYAAELAARYPRWKDAALYPEVRYVKPADIEPSFFKYTRDKSAEHYLDWFNTTVATPPPDPAGATVTGRLHPSTHPTSPASDGSPRRLRTAASIPSISGSRNLTSSKSSSNIALRRNQSTAEFQLTMCSGLRKLWAADDITRSKVPLLPPVAIATEDETIESIVHKAAMGELGASRPSSGVSDSHAHNHDHDMDDAEVKDSAPNFNVSILAAQSMRWRPAVHAYEFEDPATHRTMDPVLCNPEVAAVKVVLDPMSSRNKIVFPPSDTKVARAAAAAAAASGAPVTPQLSAAEDKKARNYRKPWAEQKLTLDDMRQAVRARQEQEARARTPLKHMRETTVKLSRFKHVPGAKQCEHLFQHYTLPDGSTVHYYHSDTVCELYGDRVPQPPLLPRTIEELGLTEYPHVPPAVKPRLPDIPPLIVPSFAVRPPVPAHKPASDAARLEFTVAELAPEGPVRSQSLRLLEPDSQWNVYQSVFRPRLRESYSRSFYDAGRSKVDGFEVDWQRVLGKRGVEALIRKATKAVGGDVGQGCVGPVRETMHEHYDVLCRIFDYYSVLGDGLSCAIGPNAFHSLCKQCDVVDESSKECQQRHLDVMFTTINYHERQAAHRGNVRQALMRFEFMEAVLRIAIAKFIWSDRAEPSVAAAINRLVAEHLVKRSPAAATHDKDEYRRTRLYTQEVDIMLRRNLPLLRKIFQAASHATRSDGHRTQAMSMDDWQALLQQLGFLESSSGLSITDARLVFTWSKMAVKDELDDQGSWTTLTFTDFLEAIARLADAVLVPTEQDLKSADCGTMLEFLDVVPQRSLPQYRRSSVDLSAPKTRPLAEKLQRMLEFVVPKCLKIYGIAADATQ